MNRDDRLFAIIGGALVTAAATVFLTLAGGITGPIEDRPTIRVQPIPRVAERAEPTPEVVHADFAEPAPTDGDDFVRSLVSTLSAHPQWSSWLISDGLVERFVSGVEAVADGYSPRSEIDFVHAGRPFLVREDEGRLVIAAGTFRRYNLAVDVFSSLDADGVVAILHELGPAIAKARDNVAWHRGDFEDRLRHAIDHLLEVEIPTGPIEVERRSVSYAFASDELERLSDAQRQLLRMGRSNAMAVQTKLLEIRSAFGWPADPAPEMIRHAVDLDGEDPAEVPLLVAEAVSQDPESEKSPLIGVGEPAMTPLIAPAPEIGGAGLAVDGEVATPSE